MEEHILEDFDYELIAKQAHSSKFHFLRVFTMLTEKTLGEYIRERRLSLAAQEIMAEEKKIIDIALKYGYESGSAFTKAFKRFHGQTPIQAQTSQSILKATPPLKLIIQVKGEERMDYRIEKKEAFTAIGVSLDVTSKDGANLRIIPEFWKKKEDDGTIASITPQTTSQGLLGICYDFDMPQEKFKYLIGVEGETPSDKMDTVLAIEAKTWAIFPGQGPMPDSIQSVWKKIFSEWFPATNYEHDEGPEIEAYYKMDEPDEYFEVWIPVKLKSGDKA